MYCKICGTPLTVFKKTNPYPIFALAGLLIAPVKELEEHLPLRPFERIYLLCPICGDIPFEPEGF